MRCLFVTFVEKAKDVLKLFSSSGSLANLVFPHDIVWRYSDGVSLIGALTADGV